MKCLALDGNSLAYRAFFALPSDMATAGGQVTNAVVGFTSMLVNLLKDQRPDAIVVVFDRPEPTFRHLAVPEYKAQRESAPEILRQQMGLIRELLAALGVTVLDMEGFEGDDIIATLARRCEASGDDIVIVTGDRDSYQLVRDPHVKVLYNKRGVSDYALYDEAGIKEKTGVEPSRYVDYAALRGDPSDNLVGANGVGEKTAAKLVNEHSSLIAILDSAATQTPKIRGALEEGRDRVLRNAELMALRDDLDIAVEPGLCQPSPDWNATQRILDFLEMKTMAKRLRDAFGPWSPGPGADAAGDSTPSVVRLSGDFTQFEAKALTALVADAERSDHLSFVDAGGAGLAVAFGAAIDAPCVVFGRNDLEALGSCLRAAPFLVAHDAKPVWRRLLEVGVDIGTLGFDTAIAAYLLEPVEGSHGLDRLIDTQLDVSLPASSAESSGQLDFGATGGDDAILSSAAAKARAVSLLVAPLTAALADNGMDDLFRSIEMPLVGVLARMEVRGIAVDTTALDAITRSLTERAGALAADLHRLAGRDFNLNSPTQLQKVLFEDKGLSKGKKTKTGYSTDAATLEKLRDEWPEFIDALLEYREVENYAARTVKVCVRRLHATGESTRSSTRPSPARADSAAKARTCTTFLSAAIWARCSARRSSPDRATNCWSPTTTR